MLDDKIKLLACGPHGVRQCWQKLTIHIEAHWHRGDKVIIDAHWHRGDKVKCGSPAETPGKSTLSCTPLNVCPKRNLSMLPLNLRKLWPKCEKVKTSQRFSNSRMVRYVWSKHVTKHQCRSSLRTHLSCLISARTRWHSLSISHEPTPAF